MYPCTSKVSKLLDERVSPHVTGRVELFPISTSRVTELWVSRWENNSASNKALEGSMGELLGK
jgi:hypothetical protein